MLRCVRFVAHLVVVTQLVEAQFLHVRLDMRLMVRWRDRAGRLCGK